MSFHDVCLWASLYAVIFVPGIITLILVREKLDKRVKYIMPILALALMILVVFTSAIEPGNLFFDYAFTQFWFLLITCVLADLIPKFKKLNPLVYVPYLIIGYFIIYFILTVVIYPIFHSEISYDWF